MEGYEESEQRGVFAGLWVVGAAVILGLLGDVLCRATPWGLNVVVWTSLLLGTVSVIRRGGGIVFAGEGRWLLWPTVFFAATFAWRDSLTLQMINGFALLAALALIALRLRTGHLRVMALSEYMTGAWRVLGQSLTGSATVLSADLPWQELSSERWVGPASAVGRGLLIGTPLLLIFWNFFASADAFFEQLSMSLFEWLFAHLLTHLFFAAGIAWLCGGFLRETLLAPIWSSPQGSSPPRWTLSIIEICVALGLLNLLFLAFVIVQFRYLFGGVETITSSPGLTVAIYARRGFFELVTVSALVLPVLLSAHWLLEKNNPRHEQVFYGCAGILVVLLFVIMGSAMQRMWLYQHLYGLTELRFYTTVFMGWLAVVFLWFWATVLRGKRERFAFGVLVSGGVVVILLNLFNPDAVIARTNLNRRGAAFDYHYVTSLSADVVPTLVKALPQMNEETRQTVLALLRTRWLQTTSNDWRSWNWSRASAVRLVEVRPASQPTLEGIGRP